MISIKSSGSFKLTESFLGKVSRIEFMDILRHYGEVGVNALAAATPFDSGVTAASWVYAIEKKNGRYRINWSNTNVNNGVIIAVILQYGHGTGTGGWVQGIDYINPALRPIFEQMSDEIWRQVTSG